MLAYSVSTDSELQFWASALLLNMAMTSDDVKKEIIMLGGLKPLMELAIGDSDHPQCSTHAAKTLVMLGFLGELLASSHIPRGLVSLPPAKEITRVLNKGSLNLKTSPGAQPSLLKWV